MRRVVSGVLGMVALSTLVLSFGVLSAGAESGPRCADITGETHSYRGTGTGGAPPGPYTLGLELLLADSACKQIVYTVYVIQDPDSQPIAVAQTGTSTEGRPQFVTTIDDDDGTICVYATTASKGGKVHDRAPDIGCLELTAPASGGGSGFT